MEWQGLVRVVAIWSLVTSRVDSGSMTHDVVTGEPEVVCQEEIFKPSCQPSQIIFIETALYGRMRTGRCMKEDFGYGGCERDVLPVMDAECSGRRQCQIKVLDELFPVKQCHQDLKAYLEINYACLDVVSPTQRCTEPMELTEPSGYIASVVTMETGCGTSEAPFLITALPGQRINITLFDFGSRSNRSLVPAVGGSSSGHGQPARQIRTPGSGATLCKVYVTIKEPDSPRSATVCEENVRQKSAFVSLGNSVEIRVYGRGHFLLHYDMIGCPDPEPPSGGWVKRNEQSALMGCDAYKIDPWQLTCSGTVWVGQQKNCTPAQQQTSSKDKHGGNIPMGVSIVIVVILALVVGAVILIIGLVCLKRPMQEEETHDRVKHTGAIAMHEVPGDGSDDKHTMVCAVRNTHTTTVIHRLKDEQQPEGVGDNDYATTKLLTNNGQEGDYGEYIRRKPFPDPYYMSRLECCRPANQDDSPPDLTHPSDKQCLYQKCPDRNLYDVKNDAIIVDLSSGGVQGQSQGQEAEVVQLRDPRPCACVHGYEHGKEACLCNSPDYIYHRESSCMMCEGQGQGQPPRDVNVGGSGNPQSLAHFVHAADNADPNCVLCSPPKKPSTSAKPNS